ncbi:cation:proton antiporter [Candidatus Woesearchaeota archaeon]|nr:cation:proton antiporter [Candidatus Woesearchaeota archaeon]
MVLADNTLLILAVILFFGLVIPEFFKKVQLPFVTSLIFLGSILGPYGFRYVKSNEAIELFGFLGAAFLMLLAGLEVRKIQFKGFKQRILMMASINAMIPFMVGTAIVLLFGYDLKAAMVVGVIFMSTSIFIVRSSVRLMKMEHTNIGQAIIGCAELQDSASLLILALIMQWITPTTRYSLPIYFGILISSIILLRMFLPEITVYFFKRHTRKYDEYEVQLRAVIALLLFVLIIFSSLGVHSIVAAFLVGITLSDVLKSEALKHKLHTMGYGIFVPIFFFIIGMEMDLNALILFDLGNLLMVSLIIGLFISKIVSGFISAKIEEFSNRESAIFGIMSTSKLTTTLSATYAALSINIIDKNIVSSIVLLSIISTIITPLLTSIFNKKRGTKNYV